MYLFDSFEQKSRLDEFYNDLTNHILFETPVQFTKKYPQITNYSEVLHSKQTLQQILKKFVVQSQSDDAGEFLMQYSETINTEILKVLRKLLRMKRNQIKRQMLQKLISMDGNILLNFNWKVKMVVSHSSQTKCMKPICAIQLIIRDKTEALSRRITLELSKEELDQLIDTLRKLQQVMK